MCPDILMIPLSLVKRIYRHGRSLSATFNSGTLRIPMKCFQDLRRFVKQNLNITKTPLHMTLYLSISAKRVFNISTWKRLDEGFQGWYMIKSLFLEINCPFCFVEISFQFGTSLMKIKVSKIPKNCMLWIRPKQQKKLALNIFLIWSVVRRIEYKNWKIGEKRAVSREPEEAVINELVNKAIRRAKHTLYDI